MKLYLLFCYKIRCFYWRMLIVIIGPGMWFKYLRLTEDEMCDEWNQHRIARFLPQFCFFLASVPLSFSVVMIHRMNVIIDVSRWLMAILHLHCPSLQRPFHAPRLEVPTIYKHYIRLRISHYIPTKYGLKNGTNVPPRILKIYHWSGTIF